MIKHLYHLLRYKGKWMIDVNNSKSSLINYSTIFSACFEQIEKCQVNHGVISIFQKEGNSQFHLLPADQLWFFFKFKSKKSINDD